MAPGSFPEKRVRTENSSAHKSIAVPDVSVLCSERVVGVADKTASATDVDDQVCMGDSLVQYLRKAEERT